MPAWFYRDDEEIVIDETEEGAFRFTEGDFKSLSSKGKIQDGDDDDEDDNEAYLTGGSGGGVTEREYSSSQLTLRDISESLQFSLNFLGDFVVQMGIEAPINVDMKLGDMMTGDQIYTLLQAVNTLDPFDSDTGYDVGMNVEEVAEELEISLDTIVKIIEKEKLNLPFGIKTVLHSSAIEKIRSVYEFDCEQNSAENEDGEDDDEDDTESVHSDSVIDIEIP